MTAEGTPTEKNSGFTVRMIERYTDWSQHPEPVMGLPAGDIPYPVARAALASFLGSQQGRETVRALANVLDVPLSPSNEIALVAASAGNFSGVMFIESGDTRIACHIPLDSGVRSQVIWDDFALMSQIHELVPHNTPKPYAYIQLDAGIVQFPVALYQGLTNIREYNWIGGFNQFGGMWIPTRIQIEENFVAEGGLLTNLSPEQSQTEIAEMYTVLADIFLKSGETVLLMPRVNNGDFVRSGNTMYLTSARGNLLQPESNLYAQLGRVNKFGPGSLFHIDRAINMDALRSQLTQRGADADYHIRDFRSFCALPDRWNPRQKSVILPFLIFEQMLGRNRSHSLQYWPADAVFEGTVRALSQNGYSHKDQRQWWAGGTQNPLRAVEELKFRLERPLPSQIITDIVDIKFLVPLLSEQLGTMSRLVRQTYGVDI